MKLKLELLNFAQTLLFWNRQSSKMYRISLLALAILISLNISAQSDFIIETKAGAYLSSSGKTPFLNKINKYGIVPVESNVGFLNASIYQNYDSTYRNNKLQRFGYSFGVEGHANMGKHSKVLLPVAFAAIRYGGFELYAGRKKEVLGLADTTGTYGSYIWSQNAMPMPKVQISTPNFVPLLGDGLLSTNLGYSHGWFGDQKYTEGYFLHQKWIYFKLGDEYNLINLIGGLNHHVQWGGYSELLKDNDRASVNGQFPQDHYVYLNVAIPIGGLGKKPAGAVYPYYETGNRFGNHLGSIDLGFKLHLKTATLSFYRQTPWEDGQAPEVFLSADGNYTFIIEPDYFPEVKKVSIEILNTQRQGLEITRFAKWVGWKEKHPSEKQNYLNHGQYREGWTYNGNNLGAPAIIPNDEVTSENQSKNFTRFTRDNMIIAPAIAISGKINNVNYTFKNSFIHSKGLISSQRKNPISQFSSMLSATFPIDDKGLSAGAEIGVDRGELYGNQVGINLSVIKRWE